MKSLVIASAVVLALSGCATVFNGKTQAVVLSSVPEGATASVTNRAGENIQAGVTPVTLTLNRGAGYFQPETYTVTLTKDGFAPKQLTITGTVSGWFIGNILFGGLIGMLAVDPITGAMFTFPATVSGTLETKRSSTSESLIIVSTESLTAEQMQHARPLTPATQAQ